jgi:hypothetical protein
MHSFSIVFSNVEYGDPICDLLFNNSDFDKFIFVGLVNTYFKTNLFRLIQSNNQTIDFSSNINKLELQDIFEIDLDTNLLNEKVFSQVTSLNLNGKLNSIQID